ncbi:MAG: ABC transporter permease [Gemmataceae bacterium]
MNVIWTLAKKDFRLLLRDPKAAIILLVMPLIFIMVLGLSLGEGFGQKPDDRLRVSIVNLDEGYESKLFQNEKNVMKFLEKKWSTRVLEDLNNTGGIRIETVRSKEEAEWLVRNSKRPAVIVFGPRFSEKKTKASFLSDKLRPGAINPFYRDGVDLKILDAQVLQDETQLTASSIIKQVGQGSLLRVVIPWMIGRAFDKVGSKDFIKILEKEESLNDVVLVRFPRLSLSGALGFLKEKDKEGLANGLQKSIQNLFSKYDLTAKSWDNLTKSKPHDKKDLALREYENLDGSGVLHRGAIRYQTLVPSYTVMFAFFLVLTVGWLFVGERRQGTLKRLKVAPLTRTQILLGKLVPCLLISLFQGVFLLGAGKLVFGMTWGTAPIWLFVVVACTSLAAMGLALLVAAMAQTETQVAIYGTLLVLVLAGISGCLMGDRSLMPETMQQVSHITPHAWALDAYRQLLLASDPNLVLVGQACLALLGFGFGFLALAWWFLKLD